MFVIQYVCMILNFTLQWPLLETEKNQYFPFCFQKSAPEMKRYSRCLVHMERFWKATFLNKINKINLLNVSPICNS